MRLLTLTLLLSALFSWAHPQSGPRTDSWVYDQRVRSVQCFRGADELALPMLELGQPSDLVLEFDVIGSTQDEDLSYRILHCNADWQPSSLQPLEFLEGFASDRITQVRPSLQTRVDYVHYRVPFPSVGARFKASGNYVLVVHHSADEQRLVLVQRFLVAERVVGVQAQVGFSPIVSDRFARQQLAVAIQPTGLQLFDPQRELNVVLLQNQRWDLARTLSRPAYVYPTHLEYAFDAANDFLGLNEYRTLDLRSLRRIGLGMEEVSCTDTCRALLTADRPRPTYFSTPDLNGGFVTGLIPDDQRWGVFESDYVLVRFRLAVESPIETPLYVIGGFSNWQLNGRYRMRFDPERSEYRAEVLLKQGVYNYHYATYQSRSWDETVVEGSHSETENSYTVLVYFRRMGDRADRLVGFRSVSSLGPSQR